MDDPQPGNIIGRKRVDHRVEWKIRPSYLIGVVAILYVAYRVFGDTKSRDDGPVSDVDASDAQIEIDVATPGWRNAKVTGGDTGR